ncbi:MAG: ATPase, T2SS/T4P/T4SS family [Polyangiales bacterium]
MLTLIVTEKGGTPKRMEFEKDEVTVGRVPGNDIVLPKGNVSKRHSRVVLQDGRFFVVDLKSTNGTYLNGRRITTPSVIRPGDKIYIGDFIVSVEMEGAEVDDSAAPMEMEGQDFGSSDSSPDDFSEEPRGPGARPSAPGARPGPPPGPPPGPAPGPGPGAMPPRPLGPPPSLGGPPPSLGNAPPRSTVGGLGGPPAGPPAGPLGGPPPLRASQPNVPPMMGTPPSPSPLGPPPSSPGGFNAPSSPQPSPFGPPPSAGPGPSPLGPPPSMGPAPSPLGPPPSMGPAPSPLGPPPAMGPAPSPLGPPPSMGGAPAFAPQPLAPAPLPPRAEVNGDYNHGHAHEHDHDHDHDHGAHREVMPDAMPGSPATSPPPPMPAGGADEYQDALAQVVRAARQRGAESAPGDEVARARLRPIVDQAARSVALPQGVTPERAARDALAEIAGVGPFDALLDDGEVTAVVVEPSGAVFASRGGPLQPSGYVFSSAAAAAEGVDRLLRASNLDRGGRAFTEGLLADGSRIIAAFPPASPMGVVARVDRGAARAASLLDLVAQGVLNAAAQAVCAHALATRRNIVVAGPPGSGRSTLLAALIGSLTEDERPVVIESRAELSRLRRDAVALHPDGDAAATSLAQRLGLGRLVVADADGHGARVFVGALGGGSEGMLVGVEAPGARAGLRRLAALGAQDPWFPLDEAQARIAATHPLVIETARFGDGRVRVTGISEARPAADGSLQVVALHTLRVEGVDGEGALRAQLVPTGVSPSF